MGDTRVTALRSCLSAALQCIAQPQSETAGICCSAQTLPCAISELIRAAHASCHSSHSRTLTTQPDFVALSPAYCRELCGLPYVPLLPETLSRVLLPPSLQHHLDYVAQDREHGAAQLAAYVVEAFAAQLQPGGLLAAAAGTPAADKQSGGMLEGPPTAAADTCSQQDQQGGTSASAPTAAVSGPVDRQPGTQAGVSALATPATTRSSSSNASRQSGQHVLDQLLDFGFLLATCRPSMAAIANAAAAVLLSLQRHLAGSSTSSSQGATSTEEHEGGGNPDISTLRSVHAERSHAMLQ
jgi:hypothetical protein